MYPDQMKIKISTIRCLVVGYKIENQTSLNLCRKVPYGSMPGYEIGPGIFPKRPDCQFSAVNHLMEGSKIRNIVSLILFRKAPYGGTPDSQCSIVNFLP